MRGIAGLCMGMAAALTIGFSVTAAAENKVVRVATLGLATLHGQGLARRRRHDGSGAGGLRKDRIRC